MAKYDQTVIRERRIGHRTITGTDWPVVDQVLRERRDGRSRWFIVRSLCNGIPEYTKEYPTRRAALKVWIEGPEAIDAAAGELEMAPVTRAEPT